MISFNLGVEDRNFYYLSRIEEPCKGVVIQKNRPIVLTNPLEAEIARKYAKTLIYKTSEEFWNLLVSEIEGDEDPDLNFSKVPFSLINALKKRGFTRFNDIGKQLLERRMIKTKKEVEKLRKASEIASHSIEKVRDFIKPGVTELDVRAELEYWATKFGAGGFSFETIVASGPNSAIPHATASNRKIKKGDAIVIDFGPTYKLYTSDITRTFVVGKNREFEKQYTTLLEAQEMAIDLLEGGINGNWLTKKVEEKIGEKMIHSLGHGVGLDTHERPNFSENLPNGAVFTIEPGIYKKFGIRIEDVIWLDGVAQVLTTASKNLEFIKI